MKKGVIQIVSTVFLYSAALWAYSSECSRLVVTGHPNYPPLVWSTGSTLDGAPVRLAQKLAACANIIPNLESHYWWQGKLEQSAEVLIVFKTTVKMQMTLRDCVLANHPYETAEFITQPIDFGSDAYLTWIRQNVATL